MAESVPQTAQRLSSQITRPMPGKHLPLLCRPNTSDPYPAENEVITSTTPTLSWKGGNAGSYDVYFGTDINKIVTARRLKGDFNNDRTVDMADLSTFVAAVADNSRRRYFLCRFRCQRHGGYE